MHAFQQWLHKTLLAMFFRIPIGVLVEDAKHQTQLDLLNAEANSEHWQAQVEMLNKRLTRLNGRDNKTQRKTKQIKGNV